MIILIGLPKETSLKPVYCIEYYEDWKRTIEEEVFHNHTVSLWKRANSLLNPNQCIAVEGFQFD